MKDEEIDWLVYHRITGSDSITTGDLARRTGLAEDTVARSVNRLERRLLVEFTGETVHALSINESLLRCQIRYDTTLPYTIENGVIRAKKRDEP